MLLVNPPGVRICEPPPALLCLGRFFEENGVPYRILDAGIEGTLDILEGAGALSSSAAGEGDTWTRRAVRNVSRNLDLLRSAPGYSNTDRYARAVKDLQRALDAGSPPGVRLGLANYEDEGFSAVSISGLINAARNFKDNPFYPYWHRKIPEIFAEAEWKTVGISLNFLSQAVNAFALLGFLKEFAPGTECLLGGGLVTSWIRGKGLSGEFNFNGFIDGLLPGRGEEALAGWLNTRPSGPAGTTPPLWEQVPWDDYLAPERILPWEFFFRLLLAALHFLS